MKILLLFIYTIYTRILVPPERKLFFTTSWNAAIQKWQLRDWFDKLLGKIVKDKLSDYEAESGYH